MSQKKNVVKFQKFQFENLVDFEKCCKTHIFLQKSEPIQPKTSEILPNFCQKFATTLGVRWPGLKRSRERSNEQLCRPPAGQRASVGKISAKCCSFSAVSAPIFARQYAFCNIFQNLPNYPAENFEIGKILQNFSKISNFAEL